MTEPAFKIVVSVWLAAVAVWDRVERRVPNALVLPAMALALGWQIYLAWRDKTLGGLAAALVAWVVIFIVWQLHFFGGGDAKLLMTLFALFPTYTFLMLWAIVVVAVGVPRILYRRIRASRAAEATSAQATDLAPVQTRRWLPSEEDLRTRGSPDAWIFALAGAIYLWAL